MSGRERCWNVKCPAGKGPGMLKCPAAIYGGCKNVWPQYMLDIKCPVATYNGYKKSGRKRSGRKFFEKKKKYVDT